MFSIRRVASVVPIPLRGEHGPGGASRRDHERRRNLTPRTRAKRVYFTTAMQKHLFGVRRNQHRCKIKNLFFPYILGLWNIADHMDLLSPCPEKHMWGACDQVSSDLLSVKYDLFFFRVGLTRLLKMTWEPPPRLFRFLIRFLHVWSGLTVITAGRSLPPSVCTHSISVWTCMFTQSWKIHAERWRWDTH